jgi:hypothetical protein
VKRKHAEEVILGPVFKELLDPERVERMAREMQAEYAAVMTAQDARSDQVPPELRELDDRITRLRKRLRDGDPDMTEDEVQAALTARRPSVRCWPPTLAPPKSRPNCCACYQMPRACTGSRLRRSWMVTDWKPSVRVKCCATRCCWAER